MTSPLNSTSSSRAISAKRDPFLALANEIERKPFWIDSSGEWELPPEENQRQRKVRVRPPDGLRTPAEAARKLGCSIKTLNGHVATGALRYVIIGHGKKRPRKMFADADLDAFIANQTRKDVPCPSTKTRTVARRSSTSTSNSTVIGFMARRNARRNVKPKK
jgi:hypothetical protein